MFFSDRTEAGRRLGQEVAHLRDTEPVVLGIPRGGMVTAYEVAAALRAPLDVVMVRKVGLPFHRTVAMGAVGEDGSVILDHELIETLGLPSDQVDLAVRKVSAKLERRSLAYRGLRPPVPLEGRNVIIVDDGVATGWTMEAACRLARKLGAASVVAAAPMAMPQVAERLETVCDKLIVLSHPASLLTVGQYYGRFDTVGDEKVREILELAERGLRRSA